MSFKSNANPNFRSKFAEDIFNNKYRHEGALTWAELSKTVVEDVCLLNMSQADKDQLAEYINELKFIPGGRYLYYAGRNKKFFNNCFGGETLVLSKYGYVPLRNFAGQTIDVFSPVDGTWKPAQIVNHGVQRLNKITFGNVRGKSQATWTVRATRDHHWLLKDGTDTYDLRVGDVVPANTKTNKINKLGFIHGFMFGDGNRHGQVRLCGAKAKWLDMFTEHCSITYPESANREPVAYCNLDIDWKIPPRNTDPEYRAGFIYGWIAADGSGLDKGVLSSIRYSDIYWFRENAYYAGYVVSGGLRKQTRDVKIGEYEYKDHTIHLCNYIIGEEFAGYKVLAIEPDGEEEVFCPFEPEFNRIVINHGIDTFNCYLLKAEEDTREDWAMLSWKSERSLSTGGGIGVDYSIYREKGRPLHGTGGTASGPIPKMEIINGIGRGVMQGGSRRSAIYASLNWQHGDIRDFLHAKDWYAMPVAGTALSMGDLKEANFNFPCPLDYTNISVNYDTEWLLNYWQTGNVGEVFKLNVLQALKTGEPGFSFNFFDKENETLRNACTEVTSADDSDVCNLGSVNLANINSLSELVDVITLATKFLLCGTLRAELPYDKVYQVREKNRRLGLGLMGIHEWLIKRGYRYEVNPELSLWLATYRGVSDTISRSFADNLGISRPVANRAIAPTGTIGILAGTTTGIEPIFATAFKRRYLVDGKKWKYQYVVDSTAQQMIDIYGVKAEDIETALDLSDDFERRIKFQADVQDYVDMSISSTINLPKFGTQWNNDTMVDKFASTLARYAHRLRGFTCYPDGSRGGQPLSKVPYSEAIEKLGEEFEEGVETTDICDITGRGGSCGV